MNPIKFIKNRFAISVLIIILIIVLIVIFSGGGDESGVDFVEAKIETLERRIDVTGRVKPAESIDLAFESSGRISSLLKDVGDRVFVGEIVARISSGSVSAELAQAKARLKSEEASLLELQIGSRPEEIAVQEVKVSNAETSVSEAKQSLFDELFTSLTTADDAVRNKTDVVFSNASSDNPKLIFTTTQNQLRIDVESGRVTIEKVLSDWGSALTNISLSSDLELASQNSRNNLSQVKIFLDKMSIIVNSLEPSPSLTQSQIDSYKSDIFTARSNINTTISNLSTDREKLKSAMSSLNLEIEELRLIEAGNTPQGILVAEAGVEEARANVLKFESELSKTIIFSPISGVVTDVLIDPGEIVTSGSKAVSLISDKNLQIEANIPEADVIFLKIGDEAKVELDAYGDEEIFLARILKIDPAETIIDGVPIYRTTFEFVQEDSRILSGMTADVSIVTDQKENSLAVPKRAVLEEEGRVYIRIWNGESIEERDVQTGFEGNDGKIEIVEGLSEGERVVTFVKK